MSCAARMMDASPNFAAPSPLPVEVSFRLQTSLGCCATRTASFVKLIPFFYPFFADTRRNRTSYGSLNNDYENKFYLNVNGMLKVPIRMILPQVHKNRPC
jgi:hypothetical protein